jgi:hypothetical protein
VRERSKEKKFDKGNVEEIRWNRSEEQHSRQKISTKVNRESVTSTWESKKNVNKGKK